MLRWSCTGSSAPSTTIAASESPTRSVASATFSSGGLSISTKSKVAFASAITLSTAFAYAVPVVRSLDILVDRAGLDAVPDGTPPGDHLVEAVSRRAARQQQGR